MSRPKNQYLWLLALIIIAFVVTMERTHDCVAVQEPPQGVCFTVDGTSYLEVFYLAQDLTANTMVKIKVYWIRVRDCDLPYAALEHEPTRYTPPQLNEPLPCRYQGLDPKVMSIADSHNFMLRQYLYHLLLRLRESISGQ